MKRFSQVEYDEAASTALVGAGLVWDDVYDALDPIDVSVVGGRASGVRSGARGLVWADFRSHRLALPVLPSVAVSRADSEHWGFFDRHT